MQISRHWRMKSLRYRLEGVRQVNGDPSLQANTPQVLTEQVLRETTTPPVDIMKDLNPRFIVSNERGR